MKSHQFEKLDSRILLHTGGVLETPDDARPTHDDLDQVAVEVVATDSHQTTDLALAAHHSGESEHGHDHSHMDPLLGSEHAALLNLVPHSQVTHRAITDGAWSVGATWENGLVPSDSAHVQIPEGMTVEVDREFSERLATIRVDGVLNFATDVDTGLIVDTFIVSTTGTLNIGTSAQPISPDATVSILFTDDGPIDTAWDPTLLSRGLLSHGSASIHGASKTGPVDLATAPEAGDTVLLLASPVDGWRVGDRVLVPGVVRPLENNQGVTQYDEDEIVTITAISSDGHQIEFDQPLQYDHVPPRAQLDIPVSNLDRNVKFNSENTTDPQRAGHVMFMHSPDVSVNFASFDHIGRNDKNIPTTDPTLDEAGNLIPETGLNARGRYAVHLHRLGSESTAATIVGSVVENSPGWGFVNHDSNALMRDNTSYNVKGAGFVTEVGSERGAFIGNLAVRSRGKNFYQPMGASDKGEGAGFGSAGHGFWLQSSSVALIDNVASGHAQEGIFIHSRSVTEFGRELPTYTSLVDTPVSTPLEFSANATEPAIRDDEVRIDQAALSEMSGNKVFASGAGLGFRWRRQTPAVAEGTAGDIFENFQIWNVEWAGIHLGYVSGLTLSDGLILGNVDNPISLSNRELDDRASEPSEFHTSVGKGIVANRNSKDLIFQNLEVAGFTVGIQALTQAHTRIDTVLLQNIEDLVIVTPQATDQSNDMRRIDATNVFHVPLSETALNGATQHNVRLLKQLDRSPVAGGRSASQQWSSFIANDEIYYNGHRLYFQDQAGDAVPFPSGDVPDFMNDGQYSQYVDQTNQQLLDNFGLALGNAVAPAEAFDGGDALGVEGLAVALDSPVEVPPRVEFGFDEDQNSRIWTLEDNDLQFTWRSKALSEDTQWRVFLNGPNGSHEIGRTRVNDRYGHVVLGEPDSGWQSWNFDWPTVGLAPRPWNSVVEVGEHSLIAVADGSPGVYLGRITVEPAVIDLSSRAATLVIEADSFEHLAAPADELVNTTQEDLATNDGSTPAAIDGAHGVPPTPRTYPSITGRGSFLPETRERYQTIEAAFSSDDDLVSD